MIIATIAGDNFDHRDLCLGKNVIGKLAFAFKQFPIHINIRRKTIQAINNLIKQQPVPGRDHISKVFPILAGIVKESKDEELLKDSMESISHISGNKNPVINTLNKV